VVAALVWGFVGGLGTMGGANVPGEAEMYGLRRVSLEGGTGEKEFGRKMWMASRAGWARWA
ncbi:MAG: hypothetical protein IK066_09550, partial [Kiritimatiellae bacterium]|nr:hypothetical protein [Kiritimatiellia bacterium]